ncbi:MAG: hypothetical protein MRERV_39c030 [Mycoplasmataceae bacterium RV_VA103A]|nr:MAG: hypothetical protein MRERV_39c030 [Mycoplasmataceae bacterium RV_VA103A]
MESGSITSKDIIGWIVSVLISLVPLLIFYLKYRIDKKKSNKKIEILENMIYKEIIARKDEIIARKDLENKELKKENEKLRKKLEEKLNEKEK